MNAHARNDQRGTTLIELTVVLMLLSIVGIVLFSFLWSVINTTTRVSSDTQGEKAIELALRPVTENVRSASTIATTYPVTNSCPISDYPSGYGSCLSFTVARPVPTSLTCPQSQFVYGLKSDGKLREDRTDFAMVGASCLATTTYKGRIILSGISNGATPLFTYFDQFGNQLNPATATATQFKAAVTIRVSLNAQYRTGSNFLRYTSDLAVRNNR